MTKCIRTIALIALSVVFILSGCTGSPVSNHHEEGPLVYYLDEASQDLVAQKTDVPNSTRKGQAKYMIEQLLSSPEGKISPLNDGTELISIVIKDEIAIVNFSKEFSGVEGIKVTLAPVAVAKTLCSLDFISGVQILVEGEDAKGADGKPLGVILESDLVLNKSEPTSAPKTAITLYFGDENAEFLVVERRNVEIANNDTIEKVIMNELLKGPTVSGNIGTIPAETKVLSIETKDKVCFVNLSKEFSDKHPGGTSAEKLTVYSIVNSLTELGTIDRVQFLIEGEKREEYVHMVFNEPIFPDKTIVKQ